MNCYIVRIYRQEADNPREFVGVVEEVGAEGKRAFTSIDELWEILKPGSMINGKNLNKTNFGHSNKERKSWEDRGS